MLKTVCVGLILIAMTGSGVLGDDCQDKLVSCNAVQADLSTSLSALAQNPSTSVVSAVNQTCLNYTIRITECTDYLKMNCNQSRTYALILQQSATVICGTDHECLVQLLQCQTHLNTVGQGQTLPGLCQKWETAKTCLNTELELKCSLESVVSFEKSAVVNHPFYSSVCNPGLNIKCPEVFVCIISAASSSSPILTCRSSGVELFLGCLADITGDCSVKNNGVTFKRVQEDATDVCQVMKREEVEVTSCPTMANCVTQTDFYKEVIDGVIGLDFNRISDVMLNSTAWCRYLEQLARCAVSSADACSFGSNYRDNMRQKAEMMEIVCSKTVSAGMTLSKPSIWLLFVLGFALTPIIRELNIV